MECKDKIAFDESVARTVVVLPGECCIRIATCSVQHALGHGSTNLTKSDMIKIAGKVVQKY